MIFRLTGVKVAFIVNAINKLKWFCSSIAVAEPSVYIAVVIIIHFQ